jgi:hypothetical protein
MAGVGWFVKFIWKNLGKNLGKNRTLGPPYKGVL